MQQKANTPMRISPSLVHHTDTSALACGCGSGRPGLAKCALRNCGFQTMTVATAAITHWTIRSTAGPGSLSRQITMATAPAAQSSVQVTTRAINCTCGEALAGSGGRIREKQTRPQKKKTL